jgi:hypothetical protein
VMDTAAHKTSKTGARRAWPPRRGVLCVPEPATPTPATFELVTFDVERVLAVVGSTSFPHPDVTWPLVHAKIHRAIRWLDPDVIVSGGAQGVDTAARRIAASYGYTVGNGRFVEFLPPPGVELWPDRRRRWEHGYRPRNEQIAWACTHLLALRSATSTTFGSGWTAKRAAELGRRVWVRTL